MEYFIPGEPEFRIKHPSNILISAPSNSGKTYLLTKILLSGEAAVTVTYDRIIYCFNVYLSETFKILKESNLPVSFIKGLPTDFAALELDSALNNCIILDDLSEDAVDSAEVKNLFCCYGHHFNTSVFLLSQNYFAKGKYARDIRANIKYFIIFKNPCDRVEIQILQNRIVAPLSKYFSEACSLATEPSRGYLLYDGSSDINDIFRLRTDITNTINEFTVFIPEALLHKLPQTPLIPNYGTFATL